MFFFLVDADPLFQLDPIEIKLEQFESGKYHIA